MSAPDRPRTGYVRLARYAGHQWRSLVVIVVLTLGSSLLGAVQPWPTKFLVDTALGDQVAPAWIGSAFEAVSLGTTPLTLVVVSALATLLLFVAGALVNAGLSWVWTVAGQRMVYDLASDLFARLQRMSLGFHSTWPVGDLLSRLTTDTWSVYTVAEAVLASPVQQFVAAAAIGGFAWRIDHQLTLLLFATGPLLAGSARFFRNRLTEKARETQAAEARLVSFVHQTLVAIPVVQAFGAQKRNVLKYADLGEQGISAGTRNVVTKTAYNSVNNLATATGTALILAVGSRRVLAGHMTAGDLIVFVAYMRTIQGAANGVLSTYGGLRSAVASMQRVFEVMDVEDEVRDRPHAIRVPRPTPGTPRGRVTFENVTYGYEPDRPTIVDINLDAQPGQTIALVGRTGAGKSTLVSLIPRFFDPWTGTIRYDGHDLRDLRLTSLRNQISLVLQEPFLLPLTIAENIAYARPDARPNRIIAAAKAANAHDFITALPNGYDTIIGERGATLSGGERQRIAIARALLKNAPVLILDEPTSAIDAQTEASILQALERLMTGRTTFIIAHRLSTIRNADLICVLEHGHIIETGTHTQLLNHHGHYHTLVRSQQGQAVHQVTASNDASAASDAVWAAGILPFRPARATREGDRTP